MIDLNAIYESIYNILDTSIGSLLATSGGSPAIDRANSRHIAGDYPRVTIDINDVTQQGGWQVGEYINDDDHTVHEVVKDLLVMVSVYGGDVDSDNENQAFYLANQAHGSFMFHTSRDYLRTSINAGVVRTDPVRDQPVILADTHIGMSNFNILLRIIDSQEDLNSSVISSVDLAGELINPSGDTTPLNKTIITP